MVATDVGFENEICNCNNGLGTWKAAIIARISAITLP